MNYSQLLPFQLSFWVLLFGVFLFFYLILLEGKCLFVCLFLIIIDIFSFREFVLKSFTLMKNVRMSTYRHNPDGH